MAPSSPKDGVKLLAMDGISSGEDLSQEKASDATPRTRRNLMFVSIGALVIGSLCIAAYGSGQGVFSNDRRRRVRRNSLRVRELEATRRIRMRSQDADGNEGTGSLGEFGSGSVSEVEVEVVNGKPRNFQIGPKVSGMYLIKGSMTLKHEDERGMRGEVKAGFVSLHSTLTGVWETGPQGLDGNVHMNFTSNGPHTSWIWMPEKVYKFQSFDKDGKNGTGSLGKFGSGSVDEVLVTAVAGKPVAFKVGPQVNGQYLIDGTMTTTDQGDYGMTGNISAGFVNLHSTLSGMWQMGPDGLNGDACINFTSAGPHPIWKWKPIAQDVMLSS